MAQCGGRISRIRWNYILAVKMFVGKPERRRPLVKPRHRFEDNIKVDR